jgi:hypothetical protein
MSYGDDALDRIIEDFRRLKKTIYNKSVFFSPL